MSATTLHLGDCLEVLRALPPCSVDAVVTDPPYHLTDPRDPRRGYPERDGAAWTPEGRERAQAKGGFMGMAWDGGDIAFRPATWAEVLRVLKPGGYLLAFGGTRAYHRMACAVEDAGFAITDCLMWLYGQGFPKSHDISKALDAAAGAEREVVGVYIPPSGKEWRLTREARRDNEGVFNGLPMRDLAITAPATPAAQEWRGYGTALKPAYEPIVLAQKPRDGTYAANVQAWGVGGLNIDGCRIAYLSEDDRASATPQGRATSKPSAAIGATPDAGRGLGRVEFARPEQKGRWPANVLLDEDAAALLDEQSGERKGGGTISGDHEYADIGYRGNLTRRTPFPGYEDSGGASRFFYVAKVSRAERDFGCDDLPAASAGEATMREDGTAGLDSPRAGAGRTGGARNIHPTLKPVALMRWLVRLVTPPGGTCLDPFMGSGTTGIACALEGFAFVGVEREAQYLAIAERRIAAWRELDPAMTVPPPRRQEVAAGASRPSLFDLLP
jgi:DNA modification methylase